MHSELFNLRSESLLSLALLCQRHRHCADIRLSLHQRLDRGCLLLLEKQVLEAVQLSYQVLHAALVCPLGKFFKIAFERHVEPLQVDVLLLKLVTFLRHSISLLVQIYDLFLEEIGRFFTLAVGL